MKKLRRVSILACLLAIILLLFTVAHAQAADCRSAIEAADRASQELEQALKALDAPTRRVEKVMAHQDHLDKKMRQAGESPSEKSMELHLDLTERARSDYDKAQKAEKAAQERVSRLTQTVSEKASAVSSACQAPKS